MYCMINLMWLEAVVHVLHDQFDVASCGGHVITSLSAVACCRSSATGPFSQICKILHGLCAVAVR